MNWKLCNSNTSVYESNRMITFAEFGPVIKWWFGTLKIEVLSCRQKPNILVLIDFDGVSTCLGLFYA